MENKAGIWDLTDPTVCLEEVKLDTIVTSVRQIPLNKLDSSQRWSVTKAMWLEIFFICFLTDFSPHPAAGEEAALAGVQTLFCWRNLEKAAWGVSGERPANTAAVLDCFALCCCPWQSTRLSLHQMKLLQAVAAPEDAESHVQVWAELFNATWKGFLQTAMTYTLKEVQYDETIEQVTRALSVRGLVAADAWQKAWNTVTSPEGWSKWNANIRP